MPTGIYKRTEKHKVNCFKKGGVGYWRNKKRPTYSKEWKEKISKTLVGNHNGFKQGKDNYSIKVGVWNKGKKVPEITGENHPNWKGGITTETTKIRRSIEYKLWVDSVFSRDNFTDQKTGVRGGDLVAHHILNFSSHPELRTSIENGITLSKKSHKEFHKKYGIKNNTKEQLEEYLGRKL